MSVLGQLGSVAVWLAVRLFPPARRTSRQVLTHAAQWHAHNARVLATGPHERAWVVLGDSSAQGVGAHAYDRGYVGQALDALRARTGCAWVVVNLSVSGARTRDLIEDQLPRLAHVRAQLGQPALVSAVVGGNDATHTPLAVWLDDVAELCAQLPRGAVVATVAQGWHERKVRVVNQRLRELAVQHELRLADIWAHTGPPYRGRYADGFHPNEAGYKGWSRALVEAVDAAAPGPTGSIAAR